MGGKSIKHSWVRVESLGITQNFQNMRQLFAPYSFLSDFDMRKKQDMVWGHINFHNN